METMENSFTELTGKPAVINHKTPRLYEVKPHILAKIVEDTARNGQWRLAAAAARVRPETVEGWLKEGAINAELCEATGIEPSILGDFWYAVKEAQAIHAMGVIDKIHDLANSGDPEYKNFYLWIVENMIEGKPYARFMRTESKEQRDVTITVEYVSSERWTGKPSPKMIESGEVVDTELIEDF